MTGKKILQAFQNCREDLSLDSALLFSGLVTSDTARLTGISLLSINSLSIKLRMRLAVECEKHNPFSGAD